MPSIGPEPPPTSEVIRLADLWTGGANQPTSHGLQLIRGNKLAPEDLDRSDPLEALAFSSLHHIDILTQAYIERAKPEYLKLATEQLLAYARLEKSSWKNTGFLWNDHAIAARIGAIIRFWKIYRQHSSFKESDASDILHHVARSVTLLASPKHFTAWSNHGVMQNIALLQAAAAFPGLTNISKIQRIAVDRLILQWGHYVSPEGPILEHSAGYHKEGTKLLKLSIDLVSGAGISVPDTWLRKAQLAEEFLKLITRPDGTLPSFGDTNYSARVASRAPRTTASTEENSLSLFPISGYGVILNQEARGPVSGHGVVAWSNFPGHAHKHADEPSLLFWAAGRDWLTSTGYSPYGSIYRTPTEGWLGSNAPHGIDEKATTSRHTRLLGAASHEIGGLLDLERIPATGHGFRRQIANLGSRVWVVIDHPIGDTNSSASETIWTFAPDLQLKNTGDGSFSLLSENGQELGVKLFFEQGRRAQISSYRGSLNPFAGWVSSTEKVVDAPALRVVGVPKTWAVTVFDLQEPNEPINLKFETASKWLITGKSWNLRRTDDKIELEAGGRVGIVDIKPLPDVSADQEKITSSLRNLISIFPKHRDLNFYRERLAYTLTLLWLAHAGIRSIISKSSQLRVLSLYFDISTLTLWMALSLWVIFIYLK